MVAIGNDDGNWVLEKDGRYYMVIMIEDRRGE